MPPGHAWPGGSAEILANTLAFPAGETSTMVVPVPWTLALSLKLLTRMSPAASQAGGPDQRDAVGVHVAVGRNGRGDLSVC